KKEDAAAGDGLGGYGVPPAKSEGDIVVSDATKQDPEISGHSYFLPEEVRLQAGEAREVSLTLRAVGRGNATGGFRLAAPEGISVEPQTIDLSPPLAPGSERVVKLRVGARDSMADGLVELSLKPDGATPAATEW